jgi:hypothetical protein
MIHEKPVPESLDPSWSCTWMCSLQLHMWHDGPREARGLSPGFAHASISAQP